MPMGTTADDSEQDKGEPLSQSTALSVRLINAGLDKARVERLLGHAGQNVTDESH